MMRMRLLGRMARPCRPCRPRGPRQPLQRRSLATDTLSPTGTNAIPRTNRDTSPPTEKRAIPLASRDTSPSAGKDTTPPNSNSTISSTSTPASMNNIPTVDHAEVKRIAEGKDGEKVALIDVRRPDEVAATGRIPRSLHIPGGELVAALTMMGDEEFQRRYGAERPDKQCRLIFSCQAGLRARSAAEMAQSLGYQCGYYPGSWAEWSAKCNSK